MSLKEQVFDDLAEKREFAEQANKTPRTIDRWCNEPDGLPYIKLGNKRYIHIPSARAWMLRRLQQPNPRRGRKPNPHPTSQQHAK
jgi:hypothetical protein